VKFIKLNQIFQFQALISEYTIEPSALRKPNGGRDAAQPV
jgi:hypothetical protein